jgi:hypothetical protein
MKKLSKENRFCLGLIIGAIAGSVLGNLVVLAVIRAL